MTLSADWQPQVIDIYDDGTRPVMGFVNPQNGLDVSYLLFPNDTEAPTSESCRDAVVNVIVSKMASTATIKDETRSNRTIKNGQTLATFSYFIEKLDGNPIHQQELFGFFGDKNTCAEVHISKSLAKPADKLLLDNTLNAFDYDPSVQPGPHEFGAMSFLFARLKQPDAAVLYYRPLVEAVSKEPADSTDRLFSRLITDQISMSYGLKGDLAHSRAINEAAIARDPDYPLYYYNLACADAEVGDAAAARTHLQQAFDRRANTLPGEHMPNPSTDDSILKLKNNKGFWAFVQSLPKS